MIKFSLNCIYLTFSFADSFLN